MRGRYWKTFLVVLALSVTGHSKLQRSGRRKWQGFGS